MFSRATAIAALVTAAAGLLLAPASQAAPPRTAQLTGTKLASALLPASYFPPGYKVVTFGDYNSGSRLEQGPAKYRLGTFSCQKYLLNGFPQTRMGETATADIVVENKALGAFQQTAWQFSSPSQAATFYQQLYTFTGRCRSVTFRGPTYTARLTLQSLTTLSLAGRPAFQAVQTQTATGFSATVNDTLVTVAGTDVFLIDAAGQNPPSTPAPATALLRLITRVQAAG